MKKLFFILLLFLVSCGHKSDVHYYMDDVLYDITDVLEDRGMSLEYEVISERSGELQDVLAKGYYSSKTNKITVFSVGRDSCDALDLIFHELGHKLFACSALMMTEYVNKEGEVFAEMFSQSFEKTPGAAMVDGVNLWNNGYSKAFPDGDVGYNSDRVLYYFYHVISTDLYDELTEVRSRYKPSNCGKTVIKQNQTIQVKVNANGDEEITIYEDD